MEFFSEFSKHVELINSSPVFNWEGDLIYILAGVTFTGLIGLIIARTIAPKYQLRAAVLLIIGIFGFTGSIYRYCTYDMSEKLKGTPEYESIREVVAIMGLGCRDAPLTLEFINSVRLGSLAAKKEIDGIINKNELLGMNSKDLELLVASQLSRQNHISCQ